MSGKASLRVVELLEKARIEGHWTQVSQVSCPYNLKDNLSLLYLDNMGKVGIAIMCIEVVYPTVMASFYNYI